MKRMSMRGVECSIRKSRLCRVRTVAAFRISLWEASLPMSLRLSEARRDVCACNVAAAISEYGICIRVPSAKAKWKTQAKKTSGLNSGEADFLLLISSTLLMLPFRIASPQGQLRRTAHGRLCERSFFLLFSVVFLIASS